MRKLAFLMAGALICTLQVFAQNKTVSGKVTDELTQKGIPDVTVIATGTTVATTTDASGNYSISVPASVKTLSYSYVGFTTITRQIGNRTTLDVEMSESTKDLAEVVVVGYGTQQRKAFTGSASNIDTKEFAQLVTPSIDKQLAGRASGVQVTNSGGLVNSPARIRIRGLNSISGSLSPLIVVDGVPIITGNLAATTNSNALGDINPNDIESMEVLKDGSATAIYGSRASGGVIMITTKKGSKSGRIRVNYDMTMGVTSAKNKWELLNASEFVTIANEKLANSNLAARAFANPNGTDTDWQSNVLVNNAFSQQHNLSFSGGGPKSTYYFSLGYSDQQGVIISNKNTAYRLRFNFESDLNKYLKLGNYTTLSKQVDYDQNNGSNSLGGAIASSLRQLPNVSPYNDSTPSGFNINFPIANSMLPKPNTQTVDDNFFNVAFTLRNNVQSSDKHRIINNSFIELSPLAGLKLRSTFSYDILADYSFQSWDPRHGDGYSSQGYSYNAQQNFQRIVWQNYASYNKSFGSHNIAATAGYEIQKDLTKWFSASGTQAADLFFIQENVISNANAVQSIGGNYTKSALESFFGRINYDFGSRYFIQATIRRDGLSSLAPETRYGNFPGFSVGWRPSEEGFWKGNAWLSRNFTDVKLRASYAVVGNPISGFPYLSTFANRPYGNISGLGPSAVGNRSLKWEKNIKYDVGLTLGFLSNRFQLTADWFMNDLNDLILAVPTPPSAGVPGNSINQNIGTARNVGLEFALSGDIIRSRDFTWSFNANFTTVNNEIKSLYTIGEDAVKFIPNGAYNLIQVGESMNVIHGYRFAGVNPTTGNPMYYNAAGGLVQHNTGKGGNNAYYLAKSMADGDLTQTTSLTFNDRVILGTALPTWFGGLGSTLAYKGLSLDFMFRFSGGNDIMNITRQEILLNQQFQNNGVEILERWTSPGQVTNVPSVRSGNGNAINQNGLAISRFVESADFVRLQNLTLAYDFGSGLSNKTRGIVSGVRIFVQAQNLFTITNYTGADPENASEAGLDAAVSPQVRILSGGLKVSF